MPAPIVLETPASERGTYVVDIAFFDENSVAVTPTAATWTLTDSLAVVINSRSAVAISPLAATATLVLQGLDLAVGAGLIGTARNILVEFTYNSTLGNGLPGKQEIRFTIADFVKPTGIT